MSHTPASFLAGHFLGDDRDQEGIEDAARPTDPQSGVATMQLADEGMAGAESSGWSSIPMSPGTDSSAHDIPGP